VSFATFESRALYNKRVLIGLGVNGNNVTKGENIGYPLGDSEFVLYHIKPRNSHQRPWISLVKSSSNKP
jgi:hypothetical protein